MKLLVSIDNGVWRQDASRRLVANISCHDSIEYAIKLGKDDR